MAQGVIVRCSFRLLLTFSDFLVNVTRQRVRLGKRARRPGSVAVPGLPDRSSRQSGPEHPMITADPIVTVELPENDEHDLGTLFVRHAEELRAYVAGHVRCTHTAADLVQDTFVRVAQQPTAAETNSRAYLYRVAHNLAIDHYRMRERRQTIPTAHEDLVEIVDDAPLPERAAEGGQHVLMLQQALAVLPSLTQEIFRLNRIEGQTYQAIARHLRISESSVQKHLSRALQAAMSCLRRLEEG
jgi:RNA polymerase sigma factor (sigma-70 family)